MKHSNRSFFLPLGFSVAAVLIFAPLILAYPDDPIPTLDFSESEKSVVVRLNFFDTLDADLESVEIVPGPSHGWAGDPAILRVKLLDLDGNDIQGFNAWHPLRINYEDDSGQDRGAVIDEARGTYPFPFVPDVATVTVTYLETQQEIISVDVVPPLHDYCRDNPDDVDCDNVVNRTPDCDINGPYSEECAGPTTTVMLDGSASSDPDGDPIDFDWSDSFVGGTAAGAMPTVEYSGYGHFDVELAVSDDFGGTATCSASVDIVDTTPPTFECNAPDTIVPPDAPISFQATASDLCVGQVAAYISGFDCYAFTKKGRRIDKTDSCQVAIAEDIITILDSGGVGDTISWTVVATDEAGNPSTTECAVEVINPGLN